MALLYLQEKNTRKAAGTRPVNDGMYGLLKKNFPFKENLITADDEEELGSAGHYTLRFESEFEPHVLSLFLERSTDVSHVWKLCLGCHLDPVMGGFDQNSTHFHQIVGFSADQRRRV